jgi:hypothetical protein
MQVDVLVYKCADFLCFEKLKSRAADHYTSLLTSMYSVPGFEQALDFMYENTSGDDPGLRLLTTKSCIKNYRQVQKNKKLMTVMVKHECNAWDVGVSLLEEHEGITWVALEAIAKDVKFDKCCKCNVHFAHNRRAPGCPASLLVNRDLLKPSLAVMCEPCTTAESWANEQITP